jgi:hypothetical protein
MKDFKWTSTKYTLSHYCHQSHDETKQSWHNVILGNMMAPIIRQAGVDLDLDLLFEDCLVPL